MKPPKKPNAGSPLRMLPEARQEEIIERLKTSSRAETHKWLADDGFATSTGALSEFWDWWHVRRQFQQTQSSVETVLENLRKAEPGLSEDKLFAYGQQIFSVLAMKNEDALDWARIQKLRQSEQRTALEARRIAVLEKKAAQADQAKGILENGELTEDQRANRMRELFGITH